MTRRVWQFALTCAAAIVLLTCALRPVYAQSTLPMCYDSTRAAYFPRPTRVADTLVTARRTATTVCIKPMRPTILLRVGTGDTVWTQPGATLPVPIVVEAGIAAFQSTLGYATSRLILNDPTSGNARVQWIEPWSGAINPTTRAFNLFSATGSTTVTTVAIAYFVVRPTLGRTNVTIAAPNIAVDDGGQSVASRVIVRNLVVCVTRC